MRYVPWARLRKDEDDNVLGVLGVAFKLRPDESYLSVTWCEYFAGDELQKRRCAATAIRNSGVECKAKARFAVAEVEVIKNFMLAAKYPLRFIHEREADNAAHAAIRRWPIEEPELLERLAEEIWSVSYSKADIDAIVQNECTASARGAE